LFYQLSLYIILILNEFRPEKQRLKQTYENIVILLNKNMANKAEGQIKLNETRDLLRDTNKEVILRVVILIKKYLS
jgi:hypothetical protein